MTEYTPRRISRSRFVTIRGIRVHVREWGEETAPPLVLLHGTQDASATFQFVVDEFESDWHFIAPDWRGHGQTDWCPQGYWFQDYIADLEAFLELTFGDCKVPLIGHSLGANVASTYAGLRPARIPKLASLDGFGLTDTEAEAVPAHLCKWLDAWRTGPEPSRDYDSVEAMATRLIEAKPRLPKEKALFLSRHSSRRTETGKYQWAFDPLHRMPIGTVHRRSEWAACVSRIEAPTLWLASDRRSRFESEPGGFAARQALIKNLTYLKVANTTHNLHHDEPAAVARHLEDFLTGA